MAAANAPITMKEALTLTSLGINPQFITFTNVTMESDKYICVRETAPQNSVVIIDMSMPTQPLRRPITADSALMNPNSRILALKGMKQLFVHVNLDEQPAQDLYKKIGFERCRVWIEGLADKSSLFVIEFESAKMMSFEMNDHKKIGLGLTGFGVFFSFLGIIFLFDKGLLAMGNILFFSGVTLTIGLKFSVLISRERFPLVLVGWPILGMIVEAYGFVHMLLR